MLFMFAESALDEVPNIDTLVTDILDEVWHEPGNGGVDAVISAPDVCDEAESLCASYQQICICRQGKLHYS